MTDLSALYAMIGTIALALFGFLGVRYASKKPSKSGTLPDTGEVFQGSPNEGINIVLRELGKMRRELDELKDWKTGFTGAIRRYLNKVAQAWTHDEPMPGPDDDDLQLLESVLPATYAHKRSTDTDPT